MDELQQTKKLATSYFERIARETGATPEAAKDRLKAEIGGGEESFIACAAVRELRHQMLQARLRSHVDHVTSSGGKKAGWDQLI